MPFRFPQGPSSKASRRRKRSLSNKRNWKSELMQRYFSTAQTYNKIYVCEALPDNDLSTGIQLARDTLKPLCDTKGVGLETYKIRDKPQFMIFMNRVKWQARAQDIFPIIHLEIHGLEDKSGLYLPSGEIIKWDEFSDSCRAINEHCSNNLLVVLAVCHGFHSVFQVTITKLTPFFSLIGPTKAVCVGQIERDFPKFYRVLLNSCDLTSAFCILGDPYQFYLCESIFVNGLIEYINKYCRGKGRQERVEELLTKVKQSPSGPLILTGDARRLIKGLIKPEAGDLENYRIKFLMADDPKNKGRFTATLDNIIEFSYRE